MAVIGDMDREVTGGILAVGAGANGEEHKIVRPGSDAGLSYVLPTKIFSGHFLL
jgi:hypothetical protein